MGNISQQEQSKLFDSVVNPLFKMLQDTTELKEVAAENVLPIYGNSLAESVAQENTLLSIAGNSQTLPTCIETIRDIALSSVVISGADRFGFNHKRDITDAERVGIADKLATIGMTADKVKKISEAISDRYNVAGNAFVILSVSSVAGALGVDIRVLPKTGVYLETTINQSGDKAPTGYIVYSPNWTKTYTNKYKPQRYALNQWERQDGNLVCAVHIRTVSDSPYYGTPHWLPVVQPAFSEWLLSDFANREIGSDLRSRLLLLIEELALFSDAESETERRAQLQAMRGAINEATTRRGSRADGVAVIGYPNGTAKPDGIVLPPNSNPDFFEKMSKLASSKIYAKMNWSAVMSGAESAAAGIGGNAFLDEYKVRRNTTIANAQNVITDAWMVINSMLALVTGLEWFADFTFTFEGKFDGQMTAKAKELMSGQQITAITALLESVNAGTVSKEAAARILVAMEFDYATALNMLA